MTGPKHDPTAFFEPITCARVVGDDDAANGPVELEANSRDEAVANSRDDVVAKPCNEGGPPPEEATT